MKLFPSIGHLEFVAMDLLCPLKKTARRNTFILIITEWFTRIARCITLQSNIASTVTAGLLEYWVYAYGALRYVFTDNKK